MNLHDKLLEILIKSLQFKKKTLIKEKAKLESKLAKLEEPETPNKKRNRIIIYSLITIVACIITLTIYTRACYTNTSIEKAFNIDINHDGIIGYPDNYYDDYSCYKPVIYIYNANEMERTTK